MILTFGFLYILSFFPLAAFKISLFIIGFQQLDYDGVWCEFQGLQFYPAWDSRGFLKLCIGFFRQSGKLLVVISQISPGPHSVLPLLLKCQLDLC